MKYLNCFSLVLDAMGKPQAGMLKGQKTFAGQYDECREISHEMQSGHVIQGQFCTPQVMLDFSSLGELAVRVLKNKMSSLAN